MKINLCMHGVHVHGYGEAPSVCLAHQNQLGSSYDMYEHLTLMLCSLGV